MNDGKFPYIAAQDFEEGFKNRVILSCSACGLLSKKCCKKYKRGKKQCKSCPKGEKK